MSFHWRRLVRKEYGSTFTWMTTAMALLIWEKAARHGWHSVGPRVYVLAPLWALTIAGYALARYLKKTGRLKDAPIATP